MAEDDLCDLVAHGHDRVERRHGILKDHGYLVAAKILDLLLGHPENILALVFNAAAEYFPRLGDQAEYAERRGRLSRAGLAHQPERFSRLDRQGNAVDRPNVPLFSLEVDGQVFYIQ